MGCQRTGTYFEVTYHLLLLDEDAGVAVQAVEVFAVVEVATLSGRAFRGAGEPGAGECEVGVGGKRGLTF